MMRLPGGLARSQDFLAGLMFLLIGIAGLALSLRHSIGTAARMGPGYFPLIVSSGLALVGAGVLAKAVIEGSEKITISTFRPFVFVIGAIFCFGWLLESWGLVVCVTLLALIARLAESPLRIRETMILAAAMVLISVLVFHEGLGLPFRLWPV